MTTLEQKLHNYINVLENRNDLISKTLQSNQFNFPEHELILRTQYNINLDIRKELEKLL